jgi:hypothetical protein
MYTIMYKYREDHTMVCLVSNVMSMAEKTMFRSVLLSFVL